VPAVPEVFVGRDELVAQLAELVDGGGTKVLSQAIQGLGGVGKTTAAAAVAAAVRERVAVVWWVRSEEPAVLVADLAELAGRLGRPDREDQEDQAGDQAGDARSARRWLEETDRRWLVVFDNVPGPAALEGWLPRRGRGAVLITSRSTQIHRLAGVVNVDVFDRRVAEHFLRTRVAAANAQAARGDVSGVIERLNGLPLALEQAAAWVARAPNRTFAQFAAIYDDAAREPLEDGTRSLGYEHTATTTWRISLKYATKESALATPLLQALSFLAPDGLPCAWLRAQAGHDHLGNATEDAVDKALAALHAYALVALTGDDTVRVHRVVQAATRRTAPADAAGFAVAVLRAQARVDDPTAARHRPVLAAIVPHALAVAATAGPAMPASREAAELVRAVDLHRANLERAREELRKQQEG
jgi:hypothetical protein